MNTSRPPKPDTAKPVSALPPDRLRAMARAWALIMRGPDVPDHPVVPTPLELRAAQACWEASLGPHYAEALEKIANHSSEPLPDIIRLTAREALRQALPQAALNTQGEG